MSSSSPMWTYAEQSEEAVAVHIRRQAEACRELFPQHEIFTRQISSGCVVIRTLHAFQGKLNRVVGFGKQDDNLRADLTELDSLFAAIGLGCEIHLSAFAPPHVNSLLLACGYFEKVVLTTQVCSLDGIPEMVGRPEPTGGLSVRKGSVSDRESFIEASVAGFQDTGRSRDLLHTLAKIATSREDTSLYLAMLDDEIAGTAALAVMDTSMGKVGHFYLDSTLPEHRGRGVHLALVQARVREMKQLGLPLATTITTARSGSARNAERAGMQIAYTTSIFSKPWATTATTLRE